MRSRSTKVRGISLFVWVVGIMFLLLGSMPFVVPGMGAAKATGAGLVLCVLATAWFTMRGSQRK